MDNRDAVRRSDERLPPLSVGHKILFGLWLFAILIIVALPMIGGYYGAVLIYTADVVYPGVRPWVTPIMAGILVAWLVASHIVELLLRRSFPPRLVALREIVSTLIGLLILAVLYGLVFTEAMASFVAAVIASALFLACAPLIKFLEKRAPERS